MPEKTFIVPNKTVDPSPAPVEPTPAVVETSQAPPEAPVVVADVAIKSVASEPIVVSVAAGKESFAPGEEKTVSPAFAEQASVLANVERV